MQLAASPLGHEWSWKSIVVAVVVIIIVIIIITKGEEGGGRGGEGEVVDYSRCKL